jgi:hypothetical protein
METMVSAPTTSVATATRVLPDAMDSLLSNLKHRPAARQAAKARGAQIHYAPQSGKLWSETQQSLASATTLGHQGFQVVSNRAAAGR